MNTQYYQVCTRCVMDTSAPDIVFDKDGFCNYCTDFLSSYILLKESFHNHRNLEEIVDRIKRQGKNKAYDCIVGVSGGVDSSMALVSAVRLGLRPLAVHMDNGWDSELAQNNIANLVNGLGVDLFTHVIDWDEYRALMQAFFDADVLDIELLYDNAMLAVNYQQAARYGIRYILAGTNHSTEGMRMPPTWNWFKFDKSNIKAIGRLGGIKSLRTFPAIGTLEYIWYRFARRVNWISFLDYFEYNKFEALKMLQNEFGYKPYPYKHYESIFTRFYQGYILPKKFGIDKRRLHLSNLIVSNQISRDEAMRLLEQSPYPSEQELEEDKFYFIKKMKWSAEQFEEYIGRPGRPHSDFLSEKPIWDYLSRFWRFISKLKSIDFIGLRKDREQADQRVHSQLGVKSQED